MPKKYEVIEWEGNTWIRRIGHDDPLAYLEGTGEEQLRVANRVAGLFGIKEFKEKAYRWNQAQHQMELIKAVPGLIIWSERDQ